MTSPIPTIDITPSVEGFARISFALNANIESLIYVASRSRSIKTIQATVIKIIAINDSLREIDAHLKAQGFTGNYSKPLV